MKKSQRKLPKNILISDFTDVYRIGLTAVIRLLKINANICSARSPMELEVLTGNARFDIVCLDIDMPDFDVYSFIVLQKRRNPATGILLFSQQLQVNRVRKLLSFGASGFINKQAMSKEILFAVSAVLDGHTYLEENVKEKLFSEKITTGFKEEESKLAKEVLYLISHELTIKEISSCLSISEKKVEYCRSNLFKTLNARNMVGLGVHAVRKNIYNDKALEKKFEKWLKPKAETHKPERNV